MCDFIVFNLLELKYDDNGVAINKQIYIPKNKIEYIEEIDKSTCKVNGRLVNHNIKEILNNIEGSCNYIL